MAHFSIWDWKLGTYRVYRTPEPEGLFDPEVPKLPPSPKQLGFCVDKALVALPFNARYVGTSDRALGRLACDATSRAQSHARLPEGIGGMGGVGGLGGFRGFGVGGLGCPDWMEQEHADALKQIASMQAALAAHDKALRAHMAKECQYLKSKGIDCQHCKGTGLGIIPGVPFLGLGSAWVERARPLLPIALAFVAGMLILKGLRPKRAKNARRRRNAHAKLKPGQKWQRGSGEYWKACDTCAAAQGPFMTEDAMLRASCRRCAKAMEDEVTGRWQRPVIRPTRSVAIR